MAVGGALGEERHSEEVRACGMGAEGPDEPGSGTGWRKGETEGRVRGTRRTASLRHLPGALLRVALTDSGRLAAAARSLFIRSLPAPAPSRVK